ncbi:hypothetical protein [Nocardia sp. NPDC004711]
MTNDDSLVLVLRVWRDGDRLLIRVLGAAEQSRVFPDAGEACDYLAAVLRRFDSSETDCEMNR